MRILQDYEVALPRGIFLIIIGLVCLCPVLTYVAKDLGIKQGKKEALEFLSTTSLPCEVVEYQNTAKGITVVRAGYLALDKEISYDNIGIIKGNELYRK